MAAPATEKMRAIVQTEYGTADVLHLAEIERPTIGADEVLVQVHAAGLDRGTWHLMAGLPYAARLAVGLRAPEERCSRSRRGRCGGRGRQSRSRASSPATRCSVSARARSPSSPPRARDKLARKPVEPQLRAGRRRAGLRDDRTARTLRRRPPAGGAEGADHRRLGRCRHLRRADRQGTRSGSHRRLQHRASSTWCARSAPTTSSTTPRTTSPTARSSTT